MALSPKDIICRADVLATELDRDYILLDAEAGDYLHLNPIGTEIWKAIETPIMIEALCERLSPRFNVPQRTIESDVIAFLEQLETRGLLTRSEAR